MHKKLVQFGAGKIGRSFVGPLFIQGGFDVVFVDIKPDLVRNLTEKRQYRVITKRNNIPDETLWIKGFRAVDGNVPERVAEEIADATLIGTSVGVNDLPSVYPVIVRGLLQRLERGNHQPVDILIAENIRHGARHFRAGLTGQLSDDYEFDRLVGLVEASIGKMVPPMTHEDLEADPLCLFAESFNILIVDRHGFKNPVPDFDGLKAVDNIAAYVDHKLLLFNMSHAATAYFAYQYDPSMRYIADALTVPEIARKVRRCMDQAAAALNRAYPEEFTLPALNAFIADLLERFQNRALRDTVERVGRDIRRKLHKNDRLVGAMLLCHKHNCPCDAIAKAVIAACEFCAADEDGNRFPGDVTFAEHEYSQGLEHILTHVCQLSKDNSLEAAVIEEIRREHFRF